MSVIEIQNLRKYYGRSRGVEDVSFSVEEGEIFGFIGPNGAGKSTTIRTLLALIFPTSGSATIFGKDCIDGMRVIDLLKYSASFYKKDCTARIKELAGALDLDLKKKIDDLSFGNKKKVGIIQGLLHEPRLIILDEPSIGLDPLMQQRFFDLLREENRKGATILFSSHILSEVQKLCSRVAIIKEGRIINIDTISALKENNYKKIALEAAHEVDQSALQFDGVTSLQVKGASASFIYRGNVNTILKKLSAMELTNVSIGEPDLEEIFMHYYR
jgi:ABC-2 type transport system ATP-binding protein